MEQDTALRRLLVAAALVLALCAGMMWAEEAGYEPPVFVPAAVARVPGVAEPAPPAAPYPSGSEGTAPSVEPAPGAPAPAGALPAAVSGAVNINEANLDALMALPGIGPVIAQNIIDYRERVGGFSTVEQLIYVDRIGEKTLDKLRPLVTVD